MTLNNLSKGQTAVIAEHNFARLKSMGIQPGRYITVIRYNLGNSVLYCRVDGIDFAIRKSVAEQIRIIK